MKAELSADLLELIVDDLADDKPTLSACALASSVLRRRARHHLFSELKISSLNRATALADFLDGDQALGASVASLLVAVELLKAAWLGAPGRIGLCALLPRFPHLAQIAFSCVDFTSLERESGPGALAAALPASLRRLAFFTCNFASDAGFIALITCAPRLRSLIVNTSTWLPPATTPDCEAYAPVIELEDLKVESLWGQTEVHRPWLSAVSTRRLRSLKMTLYGSSDIPFWQARIDQAGPAMRKLTLVNWNPSAMNLDLSSLTMLQELVVASNQFVGFGGEQEPDPSFPLVRGFETVMSPSFERATIMLNVPNPNVLLLVDWPTLRAAWEAVCLRSPQLRVTIGLRYDPQRVLDKVDTTLVACERVVAEAVVVHEMEKMVFVQRTAFDWRA